MIFDADAELTGLDERRDEIISIGAGRIRNLQILAGDLFHVWIGMVFALF